MSLLSSESIKIYAETIGISLQAEQEQVAVVVAQDVEYRLREVLQDAMKFMLHSKRNFLSVNDVNNALSNRNMEKIFGYSATTSTTFKPFSIGNVFYLEDPELDFDEILRTPLPKMPQAKYYGSHWLAIEGVQPILPQNPTQTLESLTEKTVLTSASESKPMEADVEVKSSMKHVLPKEQLVYFENVTAKLTQATNQNEINDCLKNVKQDLGLQLLLPYFIQFAAEMVARHLRKLSVLMRMIGLLDALLDNRNCFIEPYLHQMMPIILTCVVGKQLCEDPGENHWFLRDKSAFLLRKICNNYKSSYGTIKPRIIKTLVRAFLDPSKPLTTHYGAVVGLAALGHETLKLMVLPHIKSYGEMLEPIMKSEDRVASNEANRIYQALLRAVTECISHDQTGVGISSEEYRNLYGIFGEPIVAVISAKRQ